MNLIPKIIQIYLFMNPYQLSAMYQEDRTAPRSTILDNLTEVSVLLQDTYFAGAFVL